MTPLVTVDSITAAADTLRQVAIRTPLLSAPWLEERIGGPVRLKAENLQHAGAFKIRGAYTMISRLPEEARQQGVITYSSGNHAQAVALAARMFGIPAVVVMPVTAPRIKVEGARDFGAEIVLEGTTSIERQKKAIEIAHQRGLIMIPPFDHEDIIAGQGTIAVEILDDWPEVEAVVIPIGGGGMASGVAAWIKQRKPSCTVIGIEPENADAMYQSRIAGAPVTIEVKGTIADGLMPVRPGDLTFEHAHAFIDEIVRVSDDAIREAARLLLLRSKLVVEFSGAATVAALTSGAFAPAGRATAAVISGGNLDPSALSDLIRNPMHAP